jgi:hypothetical protein
VRSSGRMFQSEKGRNVAPGAFDASLSSRPFRGDPERGRVAPPEPICQNTSYRRCEKRSLFFLSPTVVLEDKDAAKMVDDVRGVMVNQIRDHFAPELGELTLAQGDDAVALVAMLTSVESWEQLRLSYRRSPLQTRRAWANTIKAIL